ncbi:MAG: PorT family protein [Muribaculaceae bacterium]|nr:PorT family protein [Muribaculaceae bacterium]
MRRFLSIIVVVLTLASFSASAQFRYAPAVGVDFTTLKFNQPLLKVDSRVGFHAGVMGELMFPGIGFGIDLGAFYSLRGAKLYLGEKEVWKEYGNPMSSLHYLSIPVNLRFKWTRMQGLEDYIAPYVFGGPTFDFLLGHSKIPALDYSFAELGLQCGIGVEIMTRWQLQASYCWGMSTAVQTKLLDDFTAKNRTWTITLLRYF